MKQHDSGFVRLLEALPGSGAQQCLRLELGGRAWIEAMPGQYCLLGKRGASQPCSYVSLPGAARRFIVATHRIQAFGPVGEFLEYSGPLGSAWPIPLHSARLLAITRAQGILALFCALDEIRCWLPWVQVRLLHDGMPLDQLPADCLPWFSRLSLAPRSSDSGWLQLSTQLDNFRPDTIYCCAPAQVARQIARICWQRGVPAERIWLRTDHVLCPPESSQPTLGRPVHRYDRVLSVLSGHPPAG